MAARQLIRFTSLKFAQLNELQHLVDTLVGFFSRNAILAQSVGDVSRDVHVREYCVGLEHHVDGAVVWRLMSNIDAVDLNAAGGWNFETGQHSQQRRLAAAGTAENREKFSLRDFEIDVIDGREVTEEFADTLNMNKVFHSPLFTRANTRVRNRSSAGVPM